MSILSAVLDLVARESFALAATGFAIGGIDDIALDAVYLSRRRPEPRTSDLMPVVSGTIAIFVAAWDEGDVIGAMLDTMLARFAVEDCRIYVGTYPNDRATIGAVALRAERDPRVRLVINPQPGPTTKGDCLNRLWDALLREEAAQGWRASAIVFHDAEDVVHRDELRVYRAMLGVYQVVQLPVMPLPDPKSRLVAGHYIDEFASAHGGALVARNALGAPLPLAGVGFAIDRNLLASVATARGGEPFDAASLTEDYELGLSTAMLGGRQTFARVRDDAGQLVAVAEYFPATIDAAVRQKARWMTGIALSGWDRMGWGKPRDWRDHWMRMRDRRAPLAVLILLAAYCALATWALAAAVHWIEGSPRPVPAPWLIALLQLNAVLLAWRLIMRAAFTGRAYGPVEALLSLPRAMVGNIVAMLAARRAVWSYVRTLRGQAARWDKTSHRFPGVVEP